MRPLKIIALILFAGIPIIALLFLIVDSRRQENERRNRHFHWKEGCKTPCYESPCSQSSLP
jgi:hypothetical protein